MKHFFILGRNPFLSTWEIISIWPAAGQKMLYGKDFLMIESGNNFKARETLECLGGTIKAGRIIGKIEKNRMSQIDQIFPLIEEFLTRQKRPIFGLSYYGPDQKIRNSVKTMGLEIKKQLRERGLSSRFVVSKQQVLSSVVVAKNKLIERGVELVLLPVENFIYLGLTETVQDFEDYSHRDYGRPARDNRSGMLPPKLAKIMINLARLPKDDLLLDPFCGSGTIIQEARLLGYQNIVGSDISAKAVNDSQKNMDWLLEKLGKNMPVLKIVKADCRDVFKQIRKPAGIVTEPFLGPPDWRFDNLQTVIKELSVLYLGLFRSANQYMDKGSPVVIVFPIWQNRGRRQCLPILPDVQKLGFIPDEFVINGQPYNSAIYERPDQRVLRQIFVFRKK